MMVGRGIFVPAAAYSKYNQFLATAGAASRSLHDAVRHPPPPPLGDNTTRMPMMSCVGHPVTHVRMMAHTQAAHAVSFMQYDRGKCRDFVRLLHAARQQ